MRLGWSLLGGAGCYVQLFIKCIIYWGFYPSRVRPMLVVALLPFQGLYLSDKRPPDLLVNVMAMKMLSKVLAWCSAMLNEWYNGSSESTSHYFDTHLLSNYFLLSARLLLSAYFLAVSCYKCMHLTTSVYGWSSLKGEISWSLLDGFKETPPCRVRELYN